MISNLSTCGFHDVSNARTTCYILVTRAIDVGFHRITKQIFRFCYKYTGFVSTGQTNQLLFSLYFSFLFTPSWTFQALYGSIGFPRERKNLCSEHWPRYRLFHLTIPHRVNDLREFLYPANSILQFGIFSGIAHVHLLKVKKSCIEKSSVSLSGTKSDLYFEHRDWTDSNRIQVSRDSIMIYFTSSIVVLSIHPSDHQR